MSESNGATIYGVAVKDIVIFALIIEAIAIIMTAFQRIGLEAPKYAKVDGATVTATTVKAEALKAGTTSTYNVLNTDITKIASKANLDAVLEANTLLKWLCKTQSTIFYPIIGAIFAIEDVTFEKVTLSA